MTRAKNIIETMEVTRDSARFLNQQETSGNIPGFEEEFPVPVVSATGNIGQIKGSSAPTPHATGMPKEGPHEIELGLKELRGFERKARAEDAAFQLSAPTDPDSAIIE